LRWPPPAAAGLGRVGLHTLRHSAASVMLTGGVPIVVVSDILGHSGIEITVVVYGHVTPHVSWDAVRALSQALRGTSEAADIPVDGLTGLRHGRPEHASDDRGRAQNEQP
jgi:hypothetical protein